MSLDELIAKAREYAAPGYEDLAEGIVRRAFQAGAEERKG